MESIERGQVSKIENVQAENKEPVSAGFSREEAERIIELSREHLFVRKKKLEGHELKLEAIKKGLESGAIKKSEESPEMVKNLTKKIKIEELRILQKELSLKDLELKINK